MRRVLATSKIGRMQPSSLPNPRSRPGVAALALLYLFGVGPVDSIGYADDSIEVPVGRRQLFLDDHGVAEIRDLERTLHQPEKRGAVIRAANPSHTIQTRTAPVWDPETKRFMIWVSGTDQPLRLSDDGLNWCAGPTPNLPVSMAVRDPRDPDPARRFKAALLNEGFAVSPDGIAWTKLDTPKVPSSDEGNFSYDPDHELFIHSVKRSGPYGRSVAIATSRDFATWKDYGVVFHADALDQTIGRRRIAERLANPALKQTEYDVPEYYSIEIYNMGVFSYEGLYLGLPSVYHHTGKVPKDWPGFDKMRLSQNIIGLVRKYGDYTGFYNIQLAASRDLVHWERLADRAPFIEASPLGAGAYDIQTIIGPSAPVVREDQLWFYYTGIQQYAFIGSGVDPTCDDYFPDAGAVCLAVLRRDGFISLDAGEKPGTVLTKPFVTSGPQLFVNVDVAKGGTFEVTALNDAGKPVATSEPVVGDQRRALVRWKPGATADLVGKTIRLRFTLHKASLYSYWFDESAKPN